MLTIFFLYYIHMTCQSLNWILLFVEYALEVKVNDVVPWVLNMILNKYIISQNPHVRQASCIWLLSLVKKLSQHKEIKVK